MGAASPDRKLAPGAASGKPGAIVQAAFATPAVQRVARRLDRIFDSLDDTPYLGEAERGDYLYFRSLFADSLERMDRKASEGRLHPLDLRGFPQELRYPGLSARIGIFIGSFDPFQMTHLAMALRFLASDAAEADALFIVPEGSADSRKPLKTDYRFRLEILKRQIAGVLDPFVLPLDIGAGADTIEIVRRLIGLHHGASLRLTHLLGSDVLPMAVGLLPDDLEAWNAEAREGRVDLDFSIHVARRDRRSSLRSYASAVRRLGVRMVVDRDPIGTPSSSAFRREGAITLVLTTEAILSQLELLFRYGMNRSWNLAEAGSPPGGSAPNSPAFGSPASGGPEYEI
jgi:hypothetical protein